jgi:hypothetical protein
MFGAWLAMGSTPDLKAGRRGIALLAACFAIAGQALVAARNKRKAFEAIGNFPL